jgi:hypothetical protein
MVFRLKQISHLTYFIYIPYRVHLREHLCSITYVNKYLRMLINILTHRKSEMAYILPELHSTTQIHLWSKIWLHSIPSGYYLTPRVGLIFFMQNWFYNNCNTKYILWINMIWLPVLNYRYWKKIPTSNILIIRTQIKRLQERNHTAYTSEYRKLWMVLSCFSVEACKFLYSLYTLPFP